MILTLDILERGKSYNGSWSRKQLSLLDVEYPLRSGWSKRIIGKEYSDVSIKEFLALKNKHLSHRDEQEEIIEGSIIQAWFDGACGPRNPGGNMGMGAIVQFEDRCDYRYEGEVKNFNNSNNVAEYKAFLLVMDMLKGIRNKNIVINGDSNLVVQQMSNRWRIKDGMYKHSALKALEEVIILKKNNNIIINWIPREQNSDADELSNEGIKKVCPEYAGFKPYFVKRNKKS